MINFLCKIVLNIFKYVFYDKCPKKIRQENDLNFGKMTLYSQRFLNCIKSLDIHKDFMRQNVLILPYCIN